MTAAGLLLGLALGLGTARAERYALVLGNNRGAAGELPLHHAEDDARKMAALLGELGEVDAEDMVVLTGARADDARRALADLNARLRGQDPLQNSLLVYYSGHADAEALHLGDSRLPLEELEDLVTGSAAGFRLLVVDACRSGALTRVKGAVAEPAVPVRTSGRVAGEGVVFLSSSAAGEDAQESSRLGGSFFTHHLVSGLRGAADGNRDGEVDLEEAYRFAYTHTVASSARTLTGVQHPTFRYELSGMDRVVLTRPGSAAGLGALALPEDRSWLVLEGGGTVAAEVGREDDGRLVHLAPGTYQLVGRGRADFVEGSVRVRRGETVAVDGGTLRRSDYARVVRKGLGERRPAVALAAGMAWRPGLESDGAACIGGGLGGGVEWARLGVQLGVHGCRGGFENELLQAESDEWGAVLSVGRRRDLGPLSLGVQLGGGPSLLVQRFETRFDREAPTRQSLAGRFEALGTLDLPVVAGVSVELAGGLGAVIWPQEDGATGEVATARRALPVVRAGLVRRW